MLAISNQILELLARLLPELYSTRSNYYYLFHIFILFLTVQLTMDDISSETFIVFIKKLPSKTSCGLSKRCIIIIIIIIIIVTIIIIDNYSE